MTSDKNKLRILALIFLSVGAAAMIYLSCADVAVLNPQGVIGEKQRALLVVASALMLIVVLPVFFLTFAIAWKYLAERKEEKYDPNWDYNFWAELIWWGIPFVIMAVLGVITWRGCHELDPFKPILSDRKPLTIQVVALQWKWLFIYPEQKVASVNIVQFPERTPINFEITADAPMNSFWIPQLGGQIYAMAGMRSKLHLMANQSGSYRGCSANISGRGFSGMSFTAKSSSEKEFDLWVKTARSSEMLDWTGYEQLAMPSQYQAESLYRLGDKELFEQIVMKPMKHK